MNKKEPNIKFPALSNNEVSNINLLIALLAIITNEIQKNKKKTKKSNKINAKKQNKLSNEIFKYIYIACFYQFFLLTWYSNLMYIVNIERNTKPLLVFCCNKLDYTSLLPKVLQKEDFINITKLSLKECD